MKWLLICATLVSCQPAAAQIRNCGEREAVVSRLAEKYGERQLGAGLTKGRIVELWASLTGSWTLLVTLPDGRSCLLSGGEAWQSIAPATEMPKGDPA